MSKFVIETRFWDIFPDALFAVVLAKGIDNESDNPAARALLAQACLDAKKFLTQEQTSQNPVVAVWREAFSKFKTKKGVRSSIEALLKRIDKGVGVGPINPVVDLYNAVSLRYGLPSGVEDLDTFVGDLRLTVTAGGDDFLALGDEEADPTLPGEVCYLDGAGAVCRCWNWRDGQRTMATEKTKNAFMVIECVDPARRADLEAAMRELADGVVNYLGGTVTAAKIMTRNDAVLEF
ncbi:MAG TPA: B3/4 domain-containing protein [Terriglobales bacterium]|nr:B3/4 domain-containing protein [Terriglobales bacterium]